MKKNYSFYCALFSLILFFSCSVEENPKDDITNEDLSYNLKQFHKIKNSREQKVAYNVLTQNERYFLWVNKLNSILDGELYNEVLDLDSDKRKLINEVLEIINADMFSKEPNSSLQYFKQIFIPDFLKRCQKSFTKTEISMIFGELDKINISDYSLKTLSKSMNYDPEYGNEECNCNTTSAVTCYSFPENCKELDCLLQSLGCGFMLAFECDGLCRLTE